MEEFTNSFLDIKDITDCWIVYGDSYESDDCLWNICSSLESAIAYLDKKLYKNPHLSKEDFSIFSPKENNIIE